MTASRSYVTEDSSPPEDRHLYSNHIPTHHHTAN